MISKLNNFPALIEMEVLNGDTWELMLSYVCNNKESLYKRMAIIKSLYVVTEKEYRIFVTYQSKLNRYSEKKREV